MPYVILPLMPLGVDHWSKQHDAFTLEQVILPLMPLGVDHSGCLSISLTPQSVILPLMPLGVDHYVYADYKNGYDL